MWTHVVSENQLELYKLGTITMYAPKNIDRGEALYVKYDSEYALRNVLSTIQSQ